MMSSVQDEVGGDDWALVAAELSRLHQRLLAQAEALQAALASSQGLYTMTDDVNGYIAPVGTSGLLESEQAALLANLQADIAVLQRLTGTLEQIRARVAKPHGGIQEPGDSP
jgi:hypothetical protein